MDNIIKEFMKSWITDERMNYIMDMDELMNA